MPSTASANSTTRRADARLAFYTRAFGHGVTLLVLGGFFVQGLLSARRGTQVDTVAPPT